MTIAFFNCRIKSTKFLRSNIPPEGALLVFSGGTLGPSGFMALNYVGQVVVYDRVAFAGDGLTTEAQYLNPSDDSLPFGEILRCYRPRIGATEDPIEVYARYVSWSARDAEAPLLSRRRDLVIARNSCRSFVALSKDDWWQGSIDDRLETLQFDAYFGTKGTTRLASGPFYSFFDVALHGHQGLDPGQWSWWKERCFQQQQPQHVNNEIGAPWVPHEGSLSPSASPSWFRVPFILPLCGVTLTNLVIGSSALPRGFSNASTTLTHFAANKISFVDGAYTSSSNATLVFEHCLVRELLDLMKVANSGRNITIVFRWCRIAAVHMFLHARAAPFVAPTSPTSDYPVSGSFVSVTFHNCVIDGHVDVSGLGMQARSNIHIGFISTLLNGSLAMDVSAGATPDRDSALISLLFDNVSASVSVAATLEILDPVAWWTEALVPTSFVAAGRHLAMESLVCRTRSVESSVGRGAALLVTASNETSLATNPRDYYFDVNSVRSSRRRALGSGSASMIDRFDDLSMLRQVGSPTLEDADAAAGISAAILNPPGIPASRAPVDFAPGTALRVQCSQRVVISDKVLAQWGVAHPRAFLTDITSHVFVEDWSGSRDPLCFGGRHLRVLDIGDHHQDNIVQIYRNLVVDHLIINGMVCNGKENVTLSFVNVTVLQLFDIPPMFVYMCTTFTMIFDRCLFVNGSLGVGASAPSNRRPPDPTWEKPDTAFPGTAYKSAHPSVWINGIFCRRSVDCGLVFRRSTFVGPLIMRNMCVESVTKRCFVAFDAVTMITDIAPFTGDASGNLLLAAAVVPGNLDSTSCRWSGDDGSGVRVISPQGDSSQPPFCGNSVPQSKVEHTILKQLLSTTSSLKPAIVCPTLFSQNSASNPECNALLFNGSSMAAFVRNMNSTTMNSAETPPECVGFQSTVRFSASDALRYLRSFSHYDPGLVVRTATATHSVTRNRTATRQLPTSEMATMEATPATSPTATSPSGTMAPTAGTPTATSAPVAGPSTGPAVVERTPRAATETVAVTEMNVSTPLNASQAPATSLTPATAAADPRRTDSVQVLASVLGSSGAATAVVSTATASAVGSGGLGGSTTSNKATTLSRAATVMQCAFQDSWDGDSDPGALYFVWVFELSLGAMPEGRSPFLRANGALVSTMVTMAALMLVTLGVGFAWAAHAEAPWPALKVLRTALVAVFSFYGPNVASVGATIAFWSPLGTERTLAVSALVLVASCFAVFALGVVRPRAARSTVHSSPMAIAPLLSQAPLLDLGHATQEVGPAPLAVLPPSSGAKDPSVWSAWPRVVDFLVQDFTDGLIPAAADHVACRAVPMMDLVVACLVGLLEGVRSAGHCAAIVALMGTVLAAFIGVLLWWRPYRNRLELALNVTGVSLSMAAVILVLLVQQNVFRDAGLRFLGVFLLAANAFFYVNVVLAALAPWLARRYPGTFLQATDYAAPPKGDSGTHRRAPSPSSFLERPSHDNAVKQLENPLTDL
mgnify:FL=1